MAERPEFVDVGPFRFPVEYDGVKLKSHSRQAGRDQFGETWLEELIIIIDPDRPEQGIRNTLIHEVLHAIIYSYGIDIPANKEADNDEREETFVSQMDSALLLTLRRNPKLVAYLCAED